MPPELFAITPPTVAKSVDAGSGPTRRLWRSSPRLTCPSVLPGSQAPAEIVTQRLSFDTHAEIVSTKDAVTLAWSGHQLNAQGLLASLKERHLQLESAVHGTFSP